MASPSTNKSSSALISFATQHKRIFLIAALVIITLAVYAPVVDFEFVAFDDDVFVYKNSRVGNGLTAENIPWAFTTFSNGNWIPLAWLSHMLDVELFGLNPGGHHLMSVFLHIAATILLYVALSGMTSAPGRSFAVAALFAVHPLHVESVAWVAERRDVLSGLFWMLVVWAYTRYARNPGWRSYLTVTACLSLGLMAKPMVITLPLVLLLLDYWPFGRFRPASVTGLLTEKLPLLGLAAASGIVTYMAQQKGGAVQSLADYPLGIRILNTPISYVMYILKMVWPRGLTMFYPYPTAVSVWQATGATLLLAGITVAAIRLRKRLPFLLVGWLWYLLTLVPVIGLVQVGSQARADRYTYLPLVGLGIMLCWGLPQVFGDKRRQRVLTAAGIFALATLVIFARIQVSSWRNTQTLFEHTLEVDPDNWLAENGYGLQLYQQGRIPEAMEHYTRALDLRPTFIRARNNLGVALYDLGRIDEAIAQYKTALRDDPRSATVTYNLGLALKKKGMIKEAEKKYQQAIRLDPDYADAHNALGLLFLEQREAGEAKSLFQRAVALNPGQETFRVNLGLALSAEGDLDAAAVQFREALRLNPNNAKARAYLDHALPKMGYSSTGSN